MTVKISSNIKNSAFLQFSKPETKPTIGGLRPESASPAQSRSTSAFSSTSNQGRYATFEFTEDPFKNYRYDDLFGIADPFEEDASSLEKKKPGSGSGKSDPFGFQVDDLAYETPVGGEPESFEAKFPKIDAFDSNFSFGNDPFSDSKTDKINGNSESLFSNNKHPFSDKNSNMNSDPFHSKKIDVKRPDSSSDNFFGKQKTDKFDNSSTKNLPNEDLQLVWAAEESIRLEEERLKREEQEKADLEYALALSKKDNNTLNRDRRRIRDFLRLGKNSPAT